MNLELEYRNVSGFKKYFSAKLAVFFPGIGLSGGPVMSKCLTFTGRLWIWPEMYV